MDKLNQKLSNCLEISDGRILYRYRLLQSDYLNLKKYLAQNHQVFEKFEDVIRYSSVWDKLFVLYASEWSRREYSGKVWRWDDILKSISIDSSGLSHANLMKITINGLKKWQRQLFVNPNSGTRQALGTLIREGGLAINYFNRTGGWIETVLAGLIENKIENRDNTITIEKYSSLIPVSIGREEVIQTLLDLTDDIYYLVKTHQLDQKTNPVDYLNQNVSHWQNSFPFSLEEESAQNLIKKLIMSSAQIQDDHIRNQFNATQRNPKDIRLKRQIVVNKLNQSTSLKAFIELPTRFILDEESFKLVTTDTLNVNFLKQTSGAVDELNVKDNLLTSRQVYPVTNQHALIFKNSNPLIIQENNWRIGVSIQIVTPTGETPKFFNRKSQSINPYQNFSMYEIDTTLPFLAEIEEDNEQIIATYAGSGSWKSKKSDALIYLPKDYEPNMANFPNAKLEKLADILQGTLFKLTGEIQVVSPPLHVNKSQVYTLKTNSLDANYLYEIRGQQLSDFIYPVNTFRGDFGIYKIDMSTFEDKRVRDGDVLIKANDSDRYQNLAELNKRHLFGNYQILIKDDNRQIVYKENIGIVPEEFRYKLLPQPHSLGQSYRGNIEFTAINPAILNVTDILASIETCPNSTNSNFELITTQVPIKKMTMCIYPRRGITHKNNFLKFKSHFPTSQTIIYDDEGKKLENINTHLFNVNDDLYGYRIKIFNALKPNIAKLTFYLESQFDNKVEYSFLLKPNEFKELEPYTWVEEIRQLLSFSDKGLNDSVIAELMIQNQIVFKIRFVNYEFEFDFNRETNELSLINNRSLSQSYNFDNPLLQAVESNTMLVAFNFESPEDGIVTIDKSDSHWSLQTINEYVENISESKGTWLIFSELISFGDDASPSIDSNILQKIRHSIRPIAYKPLINRSLTVNIEEVSEIDNTAMVPSQNLASMRYASRARYTLERHKNVKKSLSQMAFNPSHEDWSYLKSLTQICINLPMASLDNWHLARYVPEFMLAVAIYREFVLDKEICDKAFEQIGFHWELSNLHKFYQTWENYITLLNQKFDAIASKQMIIDSLIKSNQQYLEEISPVFKAFLNTKSPMPINKKAIESIINSSFESLVKSKNLLNARWVENETLLELVTKLCEVTNQSQRLSMTLLNEHPFRKLVALLPISLAWLASQKTLSDELQQIREELLGQAVAIYKVKKFDTTWFNDAFFYSLNWFNTCSSTDNEK